MDKPLVPIEFSRAQLEYLEKTFPNVVMSVTDSENKIRHYFGQQSVIEFIRTKTRKSDVSNY